MDLGSSILVSQESEETLPVFEWFRGIFLIGLVSCSGHPFDVLEVVLQSSVFSSLQDDHNWWNYYGFNTFDTELDFVGTFVLDWD